MLYINRKKLAESIGVHVNTVRTWEKFYGLPHLSVGHTKRFNLEEVERWLQKHRVESFGPITTYEIKDSEISNVG